MDMDRFDFQDFLSWVYTRGLKHLPSIYGSKISDLSSDTILKDILTIEAGKIKADIYQLDIDEAIL